MNTLEHIIRTLSALIAAIMIAVILSIAIYGLDYPNKGKQNSWQCTDRTHVRTIAWHGTIVRNVPHTYIYGWSANDKLIVVAIEPEYQLCVKR